MPIEPGGIAIHWSCFPHYNLTLQMLTYVDSTSMLNWPALRLAIHKSWVWLNFCPHCPSASALCPYWFHPLHQLYKGETITFGGCLLGGLQSSSKGSGGDKQESSCEVGGGWKKTTGFVGAQHDRPDLRWGLGQHIHVTIRPTVLGILNILWETHHLLHSEVWSAYNISSSHPSKLYRFTLK